MERVESQAYEVRCPRCDCSFAPGTRECVHCGQRIGRGLRLPKGGSVHGAEPGEWDDGETQVGTPTFLRSAVWALSLLIAMVVSALRVCSSG